MVHLHLVNGTTTNTRIQLRLILVLISLTFGASKTCWSSPNDPMAPVQANPATTTSNTTTTEPPDPAAVPDVDVNRAFKAAPGVTIIPDPRIAFVPNIGIIEGSEAVLVVDTGLGETNGKRVLSLATQIAGDREVYLTTTHFHPEHNFGASAFKDRATIIMNDTQADELQEKGPPYIELFKTFGPEVARRLEGTKLIPPDHVYSGEMTLDLGGRQVILREIPAHTRGDQLILVPDLRLIFTGDIAETRFFPIMPDADSSAEKWLSVLNSLEALQPDIVVPGHGAAGGPEVLASVRLHIEFMRDRVRALAAQGYGQKAITDLLVPMISAIYPTWDNQMFLPFEIAILFAETKEKPPQLPDF